VQVSVINSFLLEDIPRHRDTRLFEVREAFPRSSLLRGFLAHIRAYPWYIAIFSPPAATRLASPVWQKGTKRHPAALAVMMMMVLWVVNACRAYIYIRSSCACTPDLRCVVLLIEVESDLPVPQNVSLNNLVRGGVSLYPVLS